MNPTDSFYIELPSNSSHKLFKDNTINKFRVNLANPLNLEGSWEVGLVEVSYPRTFYNVPLSSYFEWRMVSYDNQDPQVKSYSKPRKVSIKGGYYNSINMLLSELKYQAHQLGSAVDISFLYNTSIKQLSLIGSKNIEIRLSDKLAYVAGWNPSRWHTVEDSARGSVDLTGGRYHFFLYCDCIQYQMVGDAYAPVLRTIKITGEWGEVVSLQYTAPHYVPVSKSFIDTIALEIRSDTGEPIDFLYGKILAKLHFRKKVTQPLLLA